MTIFHAALPADWDAAQRAGDYRMSTRGVSLDDEGFIHCSYRHQLEAVVNRFYRDVDQLVLLEIDPALVPAAVVDEPAADGIDELFPHVYGPIPLGAVVAATAWRRGDDGAYALV